MPDWEREARLLPLVKSSADLLLAILPEDSAIGRSARHTEAPARSDAS
jgi:hypothetical protein